jgi:hypothetical protein
LAASSSKTSMKVLPMICASAPDRRRRRALQEALLGVDADHAHAHVAGEGGHDLIALAEAQQAVVDEDAGELVADGPVQQRGDHGGVDAAGEAEQHLVVADLLAHPRDGVVDDVAGVHRLPQPQISWQKRSMMRSPLAGVRDLRVELHAVESRAPRRRCPASGALSVSAMTLKPAGRPSTRSPWLIQTSSRP